MKQYSERMHLKREIGHILSEVAFSLRLTRRSIQYKSAADARAARALKTQGLPAMKTCVAKRLRGST
jgi:hypothetical protein